MKKQYPSQARLRELFDYDDDGFLVWRHNKENPKKWNSRFANKRAGSFGVNKDLRVYYDVRINGELYSGAKLIYIYHKGLSPRYIFHKEQNQQNNRIENLIGTEKREGNNAGHWKSGKEYRFVAKRSGIDVWHSTIGYGRGFVLEKAAAMFANIEIDRLGLNYQKNDVSGIDPKDYLYHGDRQTKNKKNSTSIYTGVVRHQNKWLVTCAHKYICTKICEEDAARSYNKAAIAHYGASAILNDVSPF